MAQWWSIEVFDTAAQAAFGWQDAHGQAMVEAAITNQALEWSWARHEHGVVFEISFADEEQWEGFRALPAVRAALDAVPDPVNGLLVYRGRGGSSGAGRPRRPKPLAGAGAAELPEPVPEAILDLTQV